MNYFIPECPTIVDDVQPCRLPTWHMPTPCFLQVSDPVAAEFSLNTQMFLLSKKEIWLSDGSMGFGEGTDAAFSDGKSVDPR